MFVASEGEIVPSNREAYGTYIKLAWPCVLEAILLCAVNFIDTLMVSPLGENSIAAVGITAQPRFLLLACTISLNVGITAVVARRKGEGDQQAANDILQCALVVAILLGLLMATIGFVFASPIMKFVGAGPEYLEEAVSYFQVISVSVFFQTINLVINAAQRGTGNAKITLQTNLIANIVNISCNFLLINGNLGFPALGTTGAAIATAIGTVVALIVALRTLFRRNGYLNIYRAIANRIRFYLLKPVLQVASSALAEQLCLRVGFMLYAMIVAKLGTTSYATHLICMTFLNISFSLGDGIGVAASALVGQNLGAKKISHAKMYGKVGQRVAFIVSTMVFLLYILGQEQLIGIFSEDPRVIMLGGNILIVAAFTTHIQTSQIVMNGCLRGAGDSGYVAIISLISVAIVRPLVTYLLCFVIGLDVYGAWLSLFVDQIFRVTFAMRRFYGGKWSQIQL